MWRCDWNREAGKQEFLVWDWFRKHIISHCQTSWLSLRLKLWPLIVSEFIAIPYYKWYYLTGLWWIFESLNVKYAPRKLTDLYCLLMTEIHWYTFLRNENDPKYYYHNQSFLSELEVTPVGLLLSIKESGQSLVSFSWAPMSHHFTVWGASWTLIPDNWRGEEVTHVCTLQWFTLEIHVHHRFTGGWDIMDVSQKEP